MYFIHHSGMHQATIMGGNQGCWIIIQKRENEENYKDSSYSSGLYDTPLNDHRWTEEDQLVILSSNFQYAMR